MARPCKTDTVFFTRQIRHGERDVLLTAGQGDLSIGFQEVLNVYRHFYNLGLRPNTDLNLISLTTLQPHHKNG